MQTLSLSLGSCTTLVSVVSLLLSRASAASSTSTSTYALQTSYTGSTFFNGFNFYFDADPTHGFVTCVNQSTAQSTGLISASDGNPVYIGVDYSQKYNGTANYYGINGVGRSSVRIESKTTFNHGLIIADIKNMPGGVCGTWPALWTLGDGTWPYHGEIDIIEGVNANTQTLTSLHTANHCIVPNSTAQTSETGTVQATNCAYDVNTGDNSAGCGVLNGDTTSFGLNWNSNNGGVYAMEWTSNWIKTWSFHRSTIPSDITAGTPNPSAWGKPYVDFAGDCDIDSNFINHRIVLDTTFCGDWAGSVWGDSCAASTGVSSCSVYVGNNPSVFKNILSTPSRYIRHPNPRAAARQLQVAARRPQVVAKAAACIADNLIHYLEHYDVVSINHKHNQLNHHSQGHHDVPDDDDGGGEDYNDYNHFYQEKPRFP